MLPWAAHVVLVAWPIALLLGLFRSRLDRWAVGRMIVELGGAVPAPDRLRAVLAHTLHDPSVEVAYWLPDRGMFVDAARRPGHGRRGGRPGGHLPRPRRDRGSPRSSTTARWPTSRNSSTPSPRAPAWRVENERLHAEVRAQLQEVRASRARIVEPADAARRRVERDLHDGAQQRLVTGRVGASAGPHAARQRATDGRSTPCSTRPARSWRRAGRAARAGPRDLSGAAHRRRAQTGAHLRSPNGRRCQPSSTAAPAGRLPEPVEQTCYFVVSEALANAAKHAGAGRSTIDGPTRRRATLTRRGRRRRHGRGRRRAGPGCAAWPTGPPRSAAGCGCAARPAAAPRVIAELPCG